jgi:uncharacterized protein YqeY
MDLKPLTESQHTKIGELLSKAVINKEHAHVDDLRKAAVTLYSIAQHGYSLSDTEIHEILNKEGGYSDRMKELLASMANAYDDLVRGMNDPGYGKYEFTE